MASTYAYILTLWFKSARNETSDTPRCIEGYLKSRGYGRGPEDIATTMVLKVVAMHRKRRLTDDPRANIDTKMKEQAISTRHFVNFANPCSGAGVSYY